MTKKESAVLFVVLLLIGGALALLSSIKTLQKLGQPGVKVVQAPVLDEKGTIISTNSVFLPQSIEGFRSESIPVTTKEHDWLPKDTVFGRRKYFGKDGFSCVASVVLMGADRTSIHKPEYCLTGQGCVITEQNVVNIPMSQPQPYTLPVRKFVADYEVRDAEGKSAKYKAVYVFWFVAHEQLTPYHGQRMWWLARDLLLSNTLNRWAYISYLSFCLPGQEDATFARMSEFIQSTVPDFQLAAGPAVPSVASR